MKHTTLSELRGVLEQAAQTPSQAAAMADLVPELVRGLPPDRAELSSRQKYHLGSDTVLLAHFEHVKPSGGASIDSPQVIEVPYDMWIRGCVAYSVAQIPGPNESVVDLPTMEGFADLQDKFARLGACGRYQFDLNWRLDAKQGFVQRGASGEILANATSITGTGTFPAAMDWQLQKNQTIEVRIRNVYDRLLGDAVNPPIALTSELRLVVVAFYGLRIPLSPRNPRTRFGG